MQLETDGKASLLQEVRDYCDQYEHVPPRFSVENMRNNKLKDVRAHWKTSRYGYCTAVFLIKPLPRFSQSISSPALCALYPALLSVSIQKITWFCE